MFTSIRDILMIFIKKNIDNKNYYILHIKQAQEHDTDLSCHEIDSIIPNNLPSIA